MAVIVPAFSMNSRRLNVALWVMALFMPHWNPRRKRQGMDRSANPFVPVLVLVLVLETVAPLQVVKTGLAL
jgi:hypothetical protein